MPNTIYHIEVPDEYLVGVVERTPCGGAVVYFPPELAAKLKEWQKDLDYLRQCSENDEESDEEVRDRVADHAEEILDVLPHVGEVPQ